MSGGSRPYGRGIGIVRLRPLLVAALALTLVAGAGPATGQTDPEPPRPDGLIRRSNQSTFGGDGVYNTTGAGQTRVASIGARGTVRFYVRIQNDGREAGDIRVVGTRENGDFAVRYYLGSRQVSPLVKDGTLVLRGLAPGAHRTLTVEIEARAASDPGDRRRVVVSARAVLDGSVRDNVVAEARRPLFTAQQRRIAELVNQARANHGRRGLALHRQLTAKAQNWAEHMAREGRLSHSNLSSGVPPGWRALAENVGVGGSIVGVHNAFMSSSGHRGNILGNFQYLGTGYAVGHGRIWICQVFMRV